MSLCDLARLSSKPLIASSCRRALFCASESDASSFFSSYCREACPLRSSEISEPRSRMFVPCCSFTVFQRRGVFLQPRNRLQIHKTNLLPRVGRVLLGSIASSSELLFPRRQIPRHSWSCQRLSAHRPGTGVSNLVQLSLTVAAIRK